MQPETDTRQEIIKIATELFLTKGYQATSTRQIAKQLGITQPNLYHYFPSKELLYVTVLEQFSIEVGKNIVTATAQCQDLKQSLIQVVKSLMTDHPFYMQLMMMDIQDVVSKESSYALYQIWTEHYLTPIIQIFEKFDFDAERAKALSFHFLRIISPLIKPYNIGEHEKANIDEYIHLFLYGIYD